MKSQFNTTVRLIALLVAILLAWLEWWTWNNLNGAIVNGEEAAIAVFLLYAISIALGGKSKSDKVADTKPQDAPSRGDLAKKRPFFFVGFIIFGIGCIPFLLYFFGPDSSTHTTGVLLTALALMSVGGVILYAGRSRLK